MIEDTLAPLDLGEMSIAQMRQLVTRYSNGGKSRDALTDAVISLIQDRLDPFSAQKSGVICAGFNNSVDSLANFDVGKLSSERAQDVFGNLGAEQLLQKFNPGQLQRVLDRHTSGQITLSEPIRNEIRRAIDSASKKPKSTKTLAA
jgi:hypothetical protein